MRFITKSVRTPILTLVVLLTASASKAAMVEYYTEGTISNPCLSFCISGAGPVTYIPVGSVVEPASADFENFTFATLGALMNTTGSEPVELNSTLIINIFQVNPSTGTGDLFGSFSGSLQSTSSTAVFTPNEASTTIGLFTYRFVESLYPLVPVTTLGGVTILEGEISHASAVPEPGSLGLLGGGLALIGFVGQRFRRSA